MSSSKYSIRKSSGKKPAVTRVESVDQNPVSVTDSYHVPFIELNIRGEVLFLVPHGATYVVAVKNPFPHDKCSFHLEIDGVGMGSWVLKRGAVGYFERPTKVNQCFTFFSTPLVSRAEQAADMVSKDFSAIYDSQAQQALLNAPLGTGISADNVSNGLIRCTFTPEVRNEKWHSSIPVDFCHRNFKNNAVEQRVGRKSLLNDRKMEVSKADDPTNSITSRGGPYSAGSTRKMSKAKATPSRPLSANSPLAHKKMSTSSASATCRARSMNTCDSMHQSLTPGASTLQGHSSQVFGRTTLEKDRTRAVSFCVRLVAAVHDNTSRPHLPVSTPATCHPSRLFNGMRTTPPVPLDQARAGKL
jgi:hypothetical protein